MVGGSVPAAAATAEPAITITPSTGLSDVQVVEVAGTGLAANEFVIIGQCAVLATGPVCATADEQQAGTDETGNVVVALTVRRVFEGFTPEGEPAGEIDCNGVEGGCVVGIAAPPFTDSIGAPISFG